MKKIDKKIKYILNLFTANTSLKPDIVKPFIKKGKTYATDSFAIVEVKREIEGIEGIENRLDNIVEMDNIKFVVMGRR